jgi:hypothetical protein
VNLAGGGVADPQLDAIRCRVQEDEVFTVVAPLDAGDLRAGWNLYLYLGTVGDALECESD